MSKKLGAAAKSAFGWGVDWLLSNWATLAAAFAGGGGMAYLAAISAPINSYGPIAWGGVGLCSILVIAISLVGFGIWKEKLALANYSQKVATTSNVNPLSHIHKDELIKLVDFFHPYYKPVNNVRFESCDLMGPSNIYFEGGNFDTCGFHECEIVIVRTDRPVRGGIHLRRPVLVNCNIYRATFLMNFEQYCSLPEEMKKGLAVISDGRIGDV